MFIFPFQSLAAARRIQEQRAAAALAHASHFAEIKPPRSGDVGIVAATYPIENPLAAIFPDVPEDGLVYKDRLKYLAKVVPYGDGLPISAARDLYSDGGRAFFDAPIAIPALQFRNARHEWDVWMSLTPMELWSQRGGAQAATGTVVLGGLGMGWLLRQIAKKPSVKRIVVVEKDRDLLDWFGYRVCEATPAVSDVICDDLFAVASSFDAATTRYIVDIWPEKGQARYDKRLHQLRATGAKVWAWGSPRPDSVEREHIARARMALRATSRNETAGREGE